MKFGAPTLLVAVALTALVNCSSSTSTPSSASAGQAPASAGQTSTSAGQGGASGAETSDMSAAVTGPSDAHCMGRPLGISDPAICTSTAGASSFAGANGAPTAGSGGTGQEAAANGGASAGTGGVDCNLAHDSGYGDTLFDSAGDDDDCKYHMTWTSTPVAKGKPFTLTVSATSLATGAPLEHIAAQEPGKPALSRIEPFMPCEPSHLAPTADYDAPVTQIGPGTFTVGPVVFDESGRWVIRYHFYEECFNNVTTPHAHIAFFVNVP